MESPEHQRGPTGLKNLILFLFSWLKSSVKSKYGRMAGFDLCSDRLYSRPNQMAPARVATWSVSQQCPSWLGGHKGPLRSNSGVARGSLGSHAVTPDGRHQNNLLNSWNHKPALTCPLVEQVSFWYEFLRDGALAGC